MGKTTWLSLGLLFMLLAADPPAMAATAPLTGSVGASPSRIVQGGSTTITVKVTNVSSRQVSGDVVLTISDPHNVEVYRRTWQKQIPAQQTVNMTTSFMAAANAATGIYTARISSTTLPPDITNSTTFNIVAATHSPAASFGSIDNEPDMTRWERYVEGPKGFWINDSAERITDGSAPSSSGTVFHMRIAASSAYANVYRFQRKPLINATRFTYQVKFKWSVAGGRAPQALEFPFSLYTGSQRLEAAMQWVAGDGRGERWRVWGGPHGGHWTDTHPRGESWQFYQALAPDVWHSFSMSVTIQNGRVHYHSFTVDGQTFTVNAGYPGSADSTSAQTVIAFQIDNNYRGNRQDVWLDQFTLSWQP